MVAAWLPVAVDKPGYSLACEQTPAILSVLSSHMAVSLLPGLMSPSSSSVRKPVSLELTPAIPALRRQTSAGAAY